MLWLPGLPTLPLEVARQDGLYSVIKPHKNIKVVAVAAGGYLAAPALKATQNILQAHPDLNVIVSSGDQMIAGAYKAEQLAGKSGIKMYGNGCTFEAKQLILQGKQTGCSVYLPRTEGRLVVDPVPQVEEMDWRGFTGARYAGWEWVLLRREFASSTFTSPELSDSVVASAESRIGRDALAHVIDEVPVAHDEVAVVGEVGPQRERTHDVGPALRQLGLRLRWHPCVLGARHDRSKRTVDVEEDRSLFRVLRQPGHEIHAP